LSPFGATGGQSFALGDSRESPLPTLLVSVEPPAVWDTVGMRGRLWMARAAINLHHAFDADFYWVRFFLLRAARYAGRACHPASRCVLRRINPATVEVLARREVDALRSA
jgi:hypothetical protein